jgi:2-hydroxychromene-2-carboxylate isomerase
MPNRQPGLGSTGDKVTKLRVYFSFRSPYARLGVHKVAQLPFLSEIELELLPFSGPPEGVPFFDPVSSPLKRAYYAEDAPRMTRVMDLPFQRPDPFDVPLTRANRLFLAAQKEGKGLDMVLALFEARWGQGANISGMSVLADIAVSVGLPADLAKSAKTDKALGEELVAIESQVAADSVFGVPFAVWERDGKTEKFWGQDRFDLLIDLLP